MPNPFKKKAREASEKTNEELIDEITKLTRLKKDDLNKLFPSRASKQKLLDLLDIVNDSTNANRNFVRLTSNIKALSGTIVKLVKFLV